MSSARLILSNFPEELLGVIFSLCVRDDNDAVLLYQTCKVFQFVIRERQIAAQPYARRLFYNLVPSRLHVSLSMMLWNRWKWNNALLQKVGQSGNVEIVKAFCERLDPYDRNNLIVGACEGGHLELAQWLSSDHGAHFPSERLPRIIKNRHVDVLEWLVGTGEYYPLHSSNLEAAVEIGDVQLAKMLKEKMECEYKRDTVLHSAVVAGNKEMIEWVIGGLFADDDWKSLGIVDIAARHGHFAIVKWLIEELHLSISDETFLEAASGGNLQLLIWLREVQGCDQWHEDSLYAGARTGDPNIVKWMLEHECLWAPRLMALAIEKGYSDLVRWILGTDYPILTGPALSWAIARGNLDLVRILWSKMDDVDREKHSMYSSVRDAANGGHLHVVQWLLSQAQHWDQHAIRSAEHGGHFETAEWLKSHSIGLEKEGESY